MGYAEVRLVSDRGLNAKEKKKKETCTMIGGEKKRLGSHWDTHRIGLNDAASWS